MRAFRLLVASISVLFLAFLTACGGSSSNPTVVAPPVISSFTTDKDRDGWVYRPVDTGVLRGKWVHKQ